MATKRELLYFTGSRYGIYTLQLVRGLLIASALGPYYFGIWGFLLLVQQYLSYSSIGIQYAVSVELSIIDSTDSTRHGLIIGSALTTLAITSTVVLAAVIATTTLNPSLFSKYEFNTYAFSVALISILSNYQQIFVNCLRVYGRLKSIIAAELFVTMILLPLPLFFRQQELLVALIIGLTTAQIVILLVFAFTTNLPFRLTLRGAKPLIAAGLPLLIYNVTYYLIVDTGRIAVSIYYPVEVMGYYSFASTITGATLLGISSLAWVLFPSLLAKLKEGASQQEVESTIQLLGDLYVPVVFLLVLGVTLLSPLIFFVLPNYMPAQSTLIVLLLAQAVLSMAMPYNTFAIARKKQLQVAMASAFAVFVVVLLNIFIGVFRLEFVWVSVTVLIGTITYLVAQTVVGVRLLNRVTIHKLGLKVLSLSNAATIFLLALGALQSQMIWSIMGASIFLVFNRAKLARLFLFIQSR